MQVGGINTKKGVPEEGEKEKKEIKSEESPTKAFQRNLRWTQKVLTQKSTLNTTFLHRQGKRKLMSGAG